jgi:hypothetical protein
MQIFFNKIIETPYLLKYMQETQKTDNKLQEPGKNL